MHHFYRWHIANFHPPEKLKYLPSNSFYYACKYYWEKTTSFWNRYKGWNIQLLLDQALLDTTKTTCWSPKTFPVCYIAVSAICFPTNVNKCEILSLSVLTFYVNFCMSLLFEALMKNLLSYVTHQPFQFQTWMLMLRCVNIQAKKSLATSEIRLWIWDVFSLILECACYFGILYHSPWGGVRCGLKALNVKFIKLIL